MISWRCPSSSSPRTRFFSAERFDVLPRIASNRFKRAVTATPGLTAAAISSLSLRLAPGS